MTNVPVPVSDNPIVIDLPAGQKLVLGKIASGTVIEVATWHGTGRPDSRTSRMMFGISSTTPPIEEKSSQAATMTPSDSAPGDSQTAQEVDEKRSISSLAGSFVKRVTKKNGPRVSQQGKNSLFSKIKGGVASVSKKETPHSVGEKIEELDTEAWLDSLSRKSEKTPPTKSPQRKPATKTKKVAPAKTSSAKKKVSTSARPRSKR